MNKILKLSAFAVCFLLLFSFVSPVSGNDKTNIPCASSDKANAVFLYNLENDRIYFQKNIDTRVSPASTVKLMTALVAYECIPDLSVTVTVNNDAVTYTDMNVMSLKVGERISARDLLKAMLCSGYNDASIALATHACGSVEAFVEKMNQKAASLGAAGTVYKDPTGLDDSARTTARDTFLVAKAFFEQKELLDISSSASVVIKSTNMSSERKLHNRNALISGYTGTKYLNSNAMGMNVGMTDMGGYCLVTAAQKNGMTYICVVLGAEYDATDEKIYSYVIANELISHVTKTLGSRPLLEHDDILASLPVSGSSIKKSTVDTVPANDISAFLPAGYENDEKFKLIYIYEKDELKAPVEAGTRVGMIIVSYGDDILGVHDIVTAESVEKDTFISLLEGIRNFLSGNFFISTVICFSLLFIGYALLRPALLRKRRRKRRHNYR